MQQESVRLHADCVQRYIDDQISADFIRHGILHGGISHFKTEFLATRSQVHYGFVLFTLSGQGKLEFKDQQFELMANTLAVVPPRTFNRLSLMSQEWRTVWFSLKDVAHWRPLFSQPGVHDYDRVELVHHLAQGLYLSHFFGQRIEPLAQQIVQLLSDALQQPQQQDVRIQRLVSAIHDQLQFGWRIEDMCRLVHLSEAHLHRLFLKHLGCSPRQYLLQQRIETAKQWLHFNAWPVYEIAQQLGFADVSQFSHRFKQQTGLSPSAYRRQHQSNQS